MTTLPAPREKNHRSWLFILGVRVRTLWFGKMAGTSIAIASFFLLYFWVMHATASRAVPVPAIGLDALFGVQQWAVVPYASLWVYISLPPAFAANVRTLVVYAGGAILIAMIGISFYWLWPTYVASTGVDWAKYPMLQFLKSSDAGGNAFPSLHVAFAIYAARILHSQLASIQAPRWTLLVNGVWCLAIIYSTLATRQHVMWDVLGGTVTAWVAVHCVAGMLRLLRSGSHNGPPRMPTAKTIRAR